jgi:hypothetical protein
VDRPGDELLSRPGLAQEQDRRVGRRDLLDLKQNAPQRRALPDDVLEPLAREGSLAEIVVLQLKMLAEGLQLHDALAERALLVAAQEGTREDLTDQP